MAKKAVLEVEIKSNLPATEENLKSLRKQLDGLKEGTQSFEKVAKEIKKMEDALPPSITRLRDLQAQQKKVGAGSAEYVKLAAKIKDVEDALEASKEGAKSFKDQLEEAPGPIGVIFQGLKKLELSTKSFWTAFKALGIGLLVSIVGSLAAAFTQTEGAMKKLEPLMDSFGKILNGIFAALEPLFNAFIDLAITALPTVTKGIGMFYSSLVALVTYVKEAGLALYDFYAGLLTLDFERVGKAVSSGIDSFSKAGDAYTETMKRFEEGTKQQTKLEKEELAKQEEARKKAFEERIKRMDLQDKLDKAMLDKAKAEALSYAKTEEEKLEVEKKFLNMANEARMQDINDKLKLYKKDSEEFKNLQIEKIAAETDYINQTASLLEKEKQLKETKAKEDLEKQKQKAEEERGLRALAIESQIEDLDRLNAKRDMDFVDDLNRIRQKRTLLEQAEANELANTELTEFQKTEIRKKYADERIKLTEQEIETEKAAAAARTEVLLAYADVVGQFGAFLSQSAGENAKRAKNGVLLEKAAAIASIIINTQKNAAAVGYLTPMGIATLASGAIAIATAVNAAKQGMQAIDDAAAKRAAEAEAKKPSLNLGRNYEVGGLINGPRHAQGGTLIEAEGGEAIMTRGAVTMFAPLLSALNQMGGGTAFNLGPASGGRADAPSVETPSMNQTAPVFKTYVVSNELSSEMERQARLKDLSVL